MSQTFPTYFWSPPRLFNVSFFSSLDSQLVHALMVLTRLDWPLM